MLEATRHEFLQNLIVTKYESIRDLDDTFGVGQSTMPALKGLFNGTKHDPTGGVPDDQKIAAAGLVRLNLTNPSNVDTYTSATA